MNYTQKKSTCKSKNPSLINKSNHAIKNTSKILKNDYAFPLSFSYLLTTDKIIKPSTKEIINYHILNQREKFTNLSLERFKSTKEYVGSIVLQSKESGQMRFLDYDTIMENRIKDDINYKNSYIKYAYEKIDNATPIFVTNTLKSEYHPFRRDGGINQLLLSAKTAKDKEKAFDYLVFKGYQKLEESRHDFYKQRLFREDKLHNEERASIIAYEPHKTFVPHVHKLEIINGNYIVDYIKFTIKNHEKHQLGRTEIAIFEKAFDLIKDDYKLTFKDGLYYLNNYIYFKVLVQKSDTEIQSISNYMTNYIEQSHIISDNENDRKKSTVVYNAFAYYIASLKDKFIPKEDGSNYKKIRRIRYSRLLISKFVYRSIMTKEFLDFLNSVGELHKQNMYYYVTKLVEDKKLKIFKYLKINSETGEIEKDKVYYFRIKMLNFELLIDNMLDDVFRNVPFEGKLKKVSIVTKKQINLLNENHYIEEYSTNDGECVLFDEDIK